MLTRWSTKSLLLPAMAMTMSVGPSCLSSLTQFFSVSKDCYENVYVICAPCKAEGMHGKGWHHLACNIIHYDSSGSPSVVHRCQAVGGINW